MNWREIKNHYAMSVKAIEKATGVPRRTLEDWIAGRRTPPEYITKLLIEKLEGTLEGQTTIEKEKEQKTIRKKIDIHEKSPIGHLEIPGIDDEDEWTINDELIDIMIDIGILKKETNIEKIHKVLEKIEKQLDKITE